MMIVNILLIDWHVSGDHVPPILDCICKYNGREQCSPLGEYAYGSLDVFY